MILIVSQFFGGASAALVAIDAAISGIGAQELT